MANAPDVSIIVVNYNTCALLRDCLSSVMEQTRRSSFELIVVDNASRDGSVDMVRTEFPNVELIANSENKGFAYANNQAMRLAKGRYLLLLNPDTVVLNHAIDRSVEHADKNPDLGALGCRVLWPDRRPQGTIFRFASLLDLALDVLRLNYTFDGHPFFDRARYGGMDWDKEANVDCVAGCFLLVRATVVSEVGMLDEDFFMYGEEMEWCWRIWQGGIPVRYFPGATIVHWYGQSSVQVAGELKAARRRAPLLFLHKTRGFLVAWIANLIMLVGVALRVPVWAIRELYCAVRGRKTSIVPKLRVLGFHLSGLAWPVWRWDIRY